MNTKTQRTARLGADHDTCGERSGFDWAVRWTSNGEEKELVVAELSGVSTSVTDLSDLLEWFSAEQGGRLVASAVIDVSSWQRERLSGRIAWMRAEGMTLDMIADQLNKEGVPTNSGEARWQSSSVQAATGERGPETENRSDSS
jgi:hypothetical protein